MTTVLVYPGPTLKKRAERLAERRYTSLDGVRLGLLGNTKLNADAILLSLGDLLAKRYALKSVLHLKKPTFSLPAPEGIFEEMVRECDVVIAGVGD